MIIGSYYSILSQESHLADMGRKPERQINGTKS